MKWLRIDFRCGLRVTPGIVAAHSLCGQLSLKEQSAKKHFGNCRSEVIHFQTDRKRMRFMRTTGQLVDPSMTTEVSWSIDRDSLVRTEIMKVSKSLAIRRSWVAVPTTADALISSFENGRRIDRFRSSEGTLEVSVTQSDWPLSFALHANGDSALGRGSRGPVPMYLELEAHNITLQPGTPVKWMLILKPSPPIAAGDPSRIATAK